jgi:hypothetical protein
MSKLERLKSENSLLKLSNGALLVRVAKLEKWLKKARLKIRYLKK